MITLEANNSRAICPKERAKAAKKANCTPLKITVAESSFALSEEWDKTFPEMPELMRLPYLQAIERANDSKMDFRYVSFFKEGEKVAHAYFQIVTVKSNIGIETDDNFFKRSLKNVVNSIGFTILICGNAFMTGDFGFHFDAKKISQAAAFEGLQLCIEKIKSEKSLKINTVLVKDFSDEKMTTARILSNDYKYAEAVFQPNMMMDIRPEWEDFAAYLADLKSKSRVRAKKILKEAKDIEVRILSLEEIKQHESEIYSFYKEVLDRSEYNLGIVSPNYFYECRRNMPENFFVKGYFHEEKLVGFISYIFSHGEMESHFIGYNTDYNSSHRIYNFVLYDLLKTAIETKRSKLIYGRTAMGIKSTVGAIGVEMNAFVWMKNPILRAALPSFLNNLSQEEWIQRNPFKS